MDLREALTTFARSWNRLDPEPLVGALAADVRWTSQNVFADLRGKPAVAEYIRGKMDTLRASDEFTKPRAEIGETTYPRVLPCVILFQGNNEIPVALALLNVDAAGIRSVDLCTVAPAPDSARRSGEYPD